jgi:hypothetical protein
MQEKNIKYYLGKIKVQVVYQLGTSPCYTGQCMQNIPYYAISPVDPADAAKTPKYAFEAELLDKPLGEANA